MLVILLDVEDNGAGQLDLGKQVEVSQDEKDFTLRLKLGYHELLVGEKVVILVLLLVLVLVRVTRVQVLIPTVLTIP